MTDKYEFERSCQPQGVEQETPYQNKTTQWVNDINGGNYQSNGLSLIQFDLSSIFNGNNMVDPNSAYLAIPITYASAYVTAAALVAPTASLSWASTGLKNGYWNLINSIDCTMNGRTVEQSQNFLNNYVGFKMLSQMSQDDYNTIGSSLGMGSKLDNWQSLMFNGSGNTTNGTAFPASVPTKGGSNGMSNNLPFSSGSDANDNDQADAGSQFGTCYNSGLYSRMAKIPDVGGNSNNLFNSAGTSANSIQNLTNVKADARPYYTISGNIMYYYDVAIIRMCDISDMWNKLPLTRRLDATLRIYCNVGTVITNINSTTSTTPYAITSLAGNTFTNTCPLMQNLLYGAAAVYPASTTGMVSGLFVGNVPTTSIAVGAAAIVNLAAGTPQHFLTSCRMYYNTVTLKPEKLRSYISENRSKRICYTTMLSSFISSVSTGTNYSALIQSGVTNIRGILIMPLLSSTVNGTSTANTGITTFSQMQSPFDSCPMTTGPMSLTNIQVAIGGVNILSNTMSYNYDTFINNVSLYDKIASSDLGLSCGLISQAYWENAYKVYYIDCARMLDSDLMTPKNIVLSFTNNTLQTLDCLVFVEKFNECEIDVETGIITGL